MVKEVKIDVSPVEDANSSLQYFTFVGGLPSFSSSHSSSHSFDSDNDSPDDTSETSGDDLFNFLSNRDLDWQFPKPIEEEWPIPLKVEFPKSLGPKEEDVFVVKKPSSLVKVINATLGLRATNADVGYDKASISGKSSAFFCWDGPELDSPVTKVDWQEDSYHEIKDLFAELDQANEDVVVQNNVPQEVAREVVFNPVIYEEVAQEVVEMANDQDETLSNQEVADDSLDDEEVEEGRPSKRIIVTHEEMVKDEKPKKD
ncbi:hypothetical protein Tco_1110661 [Tanacetum coccineum]|uniref:Uncharacterized protein n=1 Tax=Tanacetum coccineum TaxID=301880 RepID=A0ABQ5IJI4_9ASTR